MVLCTKTKFKHLIQLRGNPQNNKKVLNLKKKKWEKFVPFYKKGLKRYNKYKLVDQQKYLVTRHANKWNSYKKSHRESLHALSRFRLFYGNLRKNKFKSIFKDTLKKYKQTNSDYFIENMLTQKFENRLDVVLYRSKFCNSIRTARQLISHGKICVNYKPVKTYSSILSPGDLVQVDLKFAELVLKSGRLLARQRHTWPHPPKHLYINYRTLQVIVGNILPVSLGHYFSSHLQLEKLMLDYKHQ